MAQKKNINLGSKASKAKGGKSSASATAAMKKVAAKPVSKAVAAKAAVKTSARAAKPAPKAVKAADTRKPATPVKGKAAPAKATASHKGDTHKPAAQKATAVKPAVKAVAAKPAPTKPAAVKPVVAKAAQAEAAMRPAGQPQSQRAISAAVDKAQGPKITAPAPQPAAPAAPVAAKPAAAPEKKADKPAAGVRHGFKVNEYVVYPTQGVGKVIGIEEEEIAGMKLEVFKIEFEKERLLMRVPMGKAHSVGMRKLADDATVKRSLDTLKGRARIKRTMWSRRAQEYIAKINSGDLISIAEVVRDLYRSEAQPEQSYSERQLYENALERLAREVAAVERLDERGAVQRITEILAKSAKGRAASGEGSGGDGDVKAA